MNKIYAGLTWWFLCVCAWCLMITELVDAWKIETEFTYKFVIALTIVLMSFLVVHAWRFVVFLWKQKFPNKGDYLRYIREVN